MTRAVLEGVSFGLKDSFTLIQNAGLCAITQVRASDEERVVAANFSVRKSYALYRGLYLALKASFANMDAMK